MVNRFPSLLSNFKRLEQFYLTDANHFRFDAMSQVPAAVLDLHARGLDIRYDDDQPSFPDATNTHLRFSGGAAALHAQQLRGCKRMKVGLRA